MTLKRGTTEKTEDHDEVLIPAKTENHDEVLIPAFEIYRLGYAAGEWGDPVQEAFQRDVLRIKGSPVKIPSTD